MKKVAYNPNSKRYEEIYPEDEGYNEAITAYWNETLKMWVTIPDRDEEE